MSSLSNTNPAMPGIPGVPGLPVLPNPQPTPSVVGKGSLVMFHYSLWKNDPNPMVIISNYEPGRMVKGINLHYLSFEYVKRVLQLNGGNSNFSYYNIKGDQYIVNAFRSYSWRGIDFNSVKVMDSKFLLTMMAAVRTFDPTQIHAIRAQIEEQLNQGFNQPQAQPTGPMPIGSPLPAPGTPQTPPGSV